MSSPRTLLGRYGLLASTLTMGLALVATGALGYAAARKAADSLIQARGIDVTLLLRRELHLVESLDADSLRGVLEELSEQQVTYLAVLDHGEIVASSGTPAGGGGGPVSGVGGMRWQHAAGHVRLVTGIGHPFRNRLAGNFRMGGARSGMSFVVEFLPGPASELTARALATLIVSCCAAALLLAAAIFSWRRAREADLLTAQLARDQQLKSLGQMSAVLSHELRNPLTALKGHTQLLLEKLSPEHAGRPGAERVLSSALRLEAIANQILDFAKPGAVSLAPADPRAVADAAVELAGEPRVRVIAGQVKAWPLDALRLEQVLVNLIRNAAQAAPEGDIDLAVGVTSGQLIFSVRDHGPGLPPGEEARIFEPFHGKNLKGTGLGLAICKQIVEAHGGRIEGANHPAGGALFRVLLPEARR
jgi:two-component system sensor histidine kinase HydH